jgi:hypothetical protein
MQCSMVALHECKLQPQRLEGWEEEGGSQQWPPAILPTEPLTLLLTA